MKFRPNLLKKLTWRHNILSRRGNIHFTYRVIADVERRQPAKMVDQYIDNINSTRGVEEIEPVQRVVFLSRERGTGRTYQKRKKRY
jgi:hypothetical protein